MSSNYYAMLFRMKYINRWALMRNIEKETLSEHSLETAFIAHCLAVIENRRFGGDYSPEKVALTALFHDTAEVITGDLPTPVKYYNDDIKSSYKEIETAAEEKLVNMLPADLKEDFLPIYSPDEKTRKLVKAADKLSALIKCKTELSLGNGDFISAEKSTKKSIKELGLSSVKVFIDEFLPAFYKALDENLEK